jgi:hypothetical protein
VSWRRDWPAAALVAAALILIVPLWCVAVPAMPDYPARLASFHLINGGTLDPATARFYRIDWMAVPNLASELLVPLLALIFPLNVAAKLFLALGVLMWVLGGGMLQRALYGRIGLAPLAGAFFAYNGNFLWGFFNYFFAAGLTLLVFAAWVETENKPGAWRTLCFILAATAIYFCHVFAAAILLVMIAGFETARAGFDLRQLLRKALAVAILFLPSATIFFFLRPDGGDSRLEFNLAATMQERFESLIGTSFDHPLYALPISLLTLLVLAVLVRRGSIHPAMRLVLAALLVGTLVAPEWAMGGWAVHLRLPAFFCIVLFAATEIRLPQPVVRAASGLALILLAWNAMQLTGAWQLYDKRYREFRSAMAALPRGQRLLTVMDTDPYGVESDQPYWHMAEFAIIDRGDMTALMFTTRGQHVVQLNPPFDRYAAASAQQGSPPSIGELNDLAAGRVNGDSDISDVFPYLMRFQCHYDEAVVVRLDGERNIAPAMLRLRHQGSFFDLYDIKSDQTCPS